MKDTYGRELAVGDQVAHSKAVRHSAHIHIVRVLEVERGYIRADDPQNPGRGYKYRHASKLCKLEPLPVIPGGCA